MKIFNPEIRNYIIGGSYFSSPLPIAKENGSRRIYDKWGEEDKTLVFDTNSQDKTKRRSQKVKVGEQINDGNLREGVIYTYTDHGASGKS